MTVHRLLLAGILSLGLVSAAAAQSPGNDNNDPPARVGRLAQISGTVSFHTSDESQWEAATLNYPITSGNSLWTEPRSHSAIDIGGSRIYLDSSTELDIGTLNDQAFVASLPQGAVYLRVSNVSSDGTFEIDTPRGAVTINQPGRYEIIAGDANRSTTVVALDGSAQVSGPGVNMTVAAGQSVFLTGQNPVTATTGGILQDDFLQYAYEAEQPYANPGPAQQYVSPGTTGYQDLNQYGQWRQTPDYGAVWMPQVQVGWAPYRYGHWAFIAPWGWTWVDDAPWGFAPFHYGRWVQINGFWGWAPGVVVAQPVYAPALVSFFGSIGGIGIGVSFSGGPAVGWVPLGPQEVWIPPYRCGPRYIRNINITNVNITKIVNVTNNTMIINNTVINNYRNYRGATVVAASDMANSRPVRRAFHNIPDNAWQGKLTQARTRFDAPVKPTLETAGLTPTTARQFGHTLPANGMLPGRQQSPGPSVIEGNRGIALGNGQRLPAFANTSKNAGAGSGQRTVATQPGLTQQDQGQQNRWLQGQGQQGARQQGQSQLKGGAPGPAFLPSNTSGQAGSNRATASLGSASGSQNRGQGWSFLPPLKNGAQGSNDRQVGLQGNAAGGWQPPQGQRDQGGNPRWASLPPLQKQPSSTRNGQAGYQGGSNWQPQTYRNGNGQAGGQNNRTWQQPQVYHNNGGQAGLQGNNRGGSQNWQYKQQGGGTYANGPQANRGFLVPQPQGNRNWQQGQSGGFTFQQQNRQPTPSRNEQNPYPYQNQKKQGGG